MIEGMIIKTVAQDDVMIRTDGGGEENIAAIEWSATTAGTAEVTAAKIVIAISKFVSALI